MSLYNKLPSTQLKNLTSADVMKLGQLSFADAKSIAQLNQLASIVDHSNSLVSKGAAIIADSLALSAQTANAASVSFKPSTIYSSEPYADTYLLEVLQITCTASGGDTASIQMGLSDGANNIIIQKATNVTASAPITFEPTSPLYINEEHYLTFINAASVDCVITVYCGIVARGGAQ